MRRGLQTAGRLLVAGLLPPLRAADEISDRLSWLVWLRWLMVLGQVFSTLLAVRLLFVPRALLPVLLGLSALLALGNLLATRSLHRQAVPRQRREVELLGFLSLDLLVFLLLLSLTQGIHNPFYPLLFVYALLGAILLPARLGWGYLLTLAVGLYLLNPVVYVFNNQQTYVRLSALVGWLIQLGVLLASWGVANSVSRRLLAWRQQAEFLQQQQSSLQKIHLLGAMGAGMAHEFASPLNTLRLRLDRLERQADSLNAAQQQDLATARKALAQCESRLRQLAALPTAESLQQSQQVALQPLLQERLAHWQARAPQIAWSAELALSENDRLALPELALKQMLDNLLRNAIEAVKDQPAGRIVLWAGLRNGRFWLRCCDNGSGWPASVRRHLGEPFISTRAEGTGLGLYTVYMLTQSLNGQVTLSDHAPQGACLEICLPLPPPIS